MGKKKKKNKLVRGIGITLVVILGLLIALPMLLEDKIANIIKDKVNESINATLDFEEADLSLLKGFPRAYLGLKNVSLVNKAPFEGDTLFAAKDIALEMTFGELFKGVDEPMAITTLNLDSVLLHIKVDADENANYDIALEEESDKAGPDTEDSVNFSLTLQHYALTNAKVVYDDSASGMHLEIAEMNHTGTGDLSLETSTLDTHTDALVSFAMDSTQYLNSNVVALDALVGIDLNESKYSFLENTAMVNQLPLVFEGFVKVNDTNQEVDISFKTPSSDFKNFLAVLPEAYSQNIDNVETTGDFEVNGQFKGVVDDAHIPTFTINLNSTNASFKYPDLPKSVRNVFIDTEINNDTGITEDTYVNIDRLSFQIDEDIFDLNAKIRDLLGNTKVNLHADGKINLENISKAYPVPDAYDLSGLLTADLTTAFDMQSIDNHQYENTKAEGQLQLAEFHYQSEELKSPVDITTASLEFNPQRVALKTFEGQMGRTDFVASGTIDNLLGYMFNDEKIEGNFNLVSDTFAVTDFMVEETVETETAEPETLEQIKIPSFLDCTIAAEAKNVLYDDLRLRDVSGQLLIKEETVTISNLRSSIFDGNIGLNGSVSTKEATPTFAMDLDFDAIKISESFKMLRIFKALAPVANALQGRLNSKIKLSGDLNNDFTPDLTTLTGDVLAQLQSAKLSTQGTPLLASLDQSFDFIDLKSLDLQDLETVLSFNNSKVAVQPFALNYQDIAMEVDGSHSFENDLQYKLTAQVPSKYLGDKVNALIDKIGDDSLKDLTIPVTASVGGNFMSPKVTTDLSSGVQKLTAQLVELQKQKLIGQGTDKAAEVLGNLLGGAQKDSTQTDSAATKNDAVKDAAKDLLGGLLGKKKKENDSTDQD